MKTVVRSLVAQMLWSTQAWGYAVVSFSILILGVTAGVGNGNHNICLDEFALFKFLNSISYVPISRGIIITAEFVFWVRIAPDHQSQRLSV